MRDIEYFLTFEWGYTCMHWFGCALRGCGPSVWAASGMGLLQLVSKPHLRIRS